MYSSASTLEDFARRRKYTDTGCVGAHRDPRRHRPSRCSIRPPFTLLKAVVVGRLNERHRCAIEFLFEENRVLRQHPEDIRHGLTGDQPRRFAASGEIRRDRREMVAWIPSRSPNCSPHPARLVRMAKSECIDRMIRFGEKSPTRVVREFEAHYNRERNRQGLGNRLIEAQPVVLGAVTRRERLGWLLSFYHRRAA